MAKLSNFFRKKFKPLSIDIKDGKAHITINADILGSKFDYAQQAVDNQIWNDIEPLMPKATGDLIFQTNMLNANTSGQVYLYPPESPQGHYLYEGVLYVDPVYNVGAFYDANYGFWSRPDVEKIPSERNLTYQRPTAVSHWGEEAYRRYKRDWVRVAKRAIK